MAISSVGNRGINASTANNQPSLAIAVNGNVVAGRCLVVLVAVDNIVTVNGAVTTANAQTASVTDAAGNAYSLAAGWNLGGGGAQAGAEVTIWLANVTTQLNSGQAITATFRTAASADATAMTAWEFQVAEANTLAIGVSAGSVSSANIPSLTVTTANETLLRVRASASEHLSGANWTGTASWTQFINTVSGAVSTLAEMAIRGEWIVATGTSVASLPVLAGTYDSAHVYATFKETLGAATGTLDTDEAADDAAVTGTVAWPEITGTLSADDDADAALFDGEVTTPVTEIIGDLAATETPDDATMTGVVLSVITGTMGAPETADDATINGGIVATGLLYVASDGADDATMTGGIIATGTLARQETADTANVTATVRWLATLTASEAADDATFDGGIFAGGPFAVSEGADDATFGGGIFASGPLQVSESPDTLWINGGVIGAGLNFDLIVTEAPDAATMAGQVTGVAGTMAATEAGDGSNLTGQVRWLAVMAVNEPSDSVVVSGLVRWLATLAATEAGDNAAFGAPPLLTAALAASETGDSAALTVTARTIAEIDATEAADTADIAGLVGLIGELAASETADEVLFSGGTVLGGALEATEAPDVCSIIITRENSLMVTEAPDTARFNEGEIDIVADIDAERTAPPEITAEDQPASDITGRETPDPAIIAKRSAPASWEARR